MSTLLCDIIPGEKGNAKSELAKYPVKLRGFYEPHYGVGIGNQEGKFLGLVCKVCNRWQEYGHSTDCPVRKLK